MQARLHRGVQHFTETQHNGSLCLIDNIESAERPNTNCYDDEHREQSTREATAGTRRAATA